MTTAYPFKLWWKTMLIGCIVFCGIESFDSHMVLNGVEIIPFVLIFSFLFSLPTLGMAWLICLDARLKDDQATE